MTTLDLITPLDLVAGPRRDLKKDGHVTRIVDHQWIRAGR